MIKLNYNKYFRILDYFDSVSNNLYNHLFDNVYFTLSSKHAVFSGFKILFYEYPIKFSVKDEEANLYISVFKSVVRVYPNYIRMEGCTYLLNPNKIKYDNFPLAVDWVFPASNVDSFLFHCCKSLRIYREGGWI